MAAGRLVPRPDRPRRWCLPRSRQLDLGKQGWGPGYSREPGRADGAWRPGVCHPVIAGAGVFAQVTDR